MNATPYLDSLAELARSVRVTDEQGGIVSLDSGATAAATMLCLAREAGRKVMLVGNGGSAAIVSHIANDLLKTVSVRAMVFTDTATLTAYSNDEGYEAAYEQQVAQWADADDLLLAVSSSGASSNILRACAAARARGSAIVTFSGFDPKNPLRRMGQLNFYVPAFAYGPVELVHAMLGHYLTDAAAAESQTQPQTTEGPAYDIQTTRSGDWWSWLRRSRASA